MSKDKASKNGEKIRTVVYSVLICCEIGISNTLYYLNALALTDMISHSLENTRAEARTIIEWWTVVRRNEAQNVSDRHLQIID
jgi:hypothetical protein